jgi:protein O-mannosyl-transferase
MAAAMNALSPRHRSLLICVLLCVVTLFAFHKVLQNDFIKLDDEDYVLQNPHLTEGFTWENVKWTFQAGYAANWHPLTWMSHMLDVKLFGLEPKGHHAVNLLFHAANAILLFLVLQRMTRAAWRSAMVAALFALHPLHVESVAWVSERKDVLSMFFFLLTLAAYQHYTDAAFARISGVRKWLWYGLAILFAALGLMSKPMLVTLPFVLLLLDHWPLRRFDPRLNPQKSRAPLFLVLEKIPFLLLCAGSSILTLQAQAKGHAMSTAEGLPLNFRLTNALASYLRYLGNTIWPTKLSVFYPHPAVYDQTADPWTATAASAALVVAAICVFAIVRWRKEPWFATGWFWYLGTLVPVIGLVQVGGQAMADRYTYLPLIGVFICLVWIAAETFKERPALLAGAGVLLVIACTALTARQTGYWKNNFTLFEHALAVTEKNGPAHNALGQEYGLQGDYDLSIKHFQAALAADPASAEAHQNLAYTLALQGKLNEAIEEYNLSLKIRPWSAPVHNDLGSLLLLQNRRDEAMEHYKEALRINPEYALAEYNLGNVLMTKGTLDQAATHFAEAVRLKPDYIQALGSLGRVRAAQGNLAEAQVHFREILRLSPTNTDTCLELGKTSMLSGQTNEAAVYFAQALKLAPDLAQKNLQAAKVLAEQRQFESAFASFTIAAWLNPADADTHQAFGVFLMQQSKLNESLSQLEEALRLHPKAELHYYVGMAKSLQGKTAEAIASYKQAIQLDPASPASLNNLAWILATHSDPALRNGTEAVSAAEEACRLTSFKEAAIVGTLAAAYAEAGRFDEATATAEKARALAIADGKPDLAARNAQLIELYRAGKAYHEPANP